MKLFSLLVLMDLLFAAVIHPMGIETYQNVQMATLLLCVMGAVTLQRLAAFLVGLALEPIERAVLAVFFDRAHRNRSMRPSPTWQAIEQTCRFKPDPTELSFTA